MNYSTSTLNYDLMISNNATSNNSSLPTAALVMQAFRTSLLPTDQDKTTVTCLVSSIDEFPPDGFTETQREHGAIIIHFLIVTYLCILLAFVCDDYFVPSLEVITQYFKLNDDVAGATFMAIGTSSPELFSSIIGSFITEGDIGIGTIVGSAVFNLLAVVAVAGIALWGHPAVKIDWYPVSRDCLFYAFTVSALVVVIKDNLVTWGEALAFLGMYIVYIIIMYYNQRIEELAHNGIRKLKKMHLRMNSVGIERTGKHYQPRLSQSQHTSLNGVIANGGNGIIQLNGQLLNGNSFKHNGSLKIQDPSNKSGERDNLAFTHTGSSLDLELQTRSPSSLNSNTIASSNSNGNVHSSHTRRSSLDRSIQIDKPEPDSMARGINSPVVIESLSDQSENSLELETDHATTFSNKLANGSMEPRLSGQSQQGLIDRADGDDARLNEQGVGGNSIQNVKSQMSLERQQSSSGKTTAITKGLNPVNENPNDVEAAKDEDDEEDERPPWQLPEPMTFLSLIWWVIQLPARLLLYITIPDCRRRGRKNLFFITFTMSCGYIALLTYVCVWMVTIIGYTLRIPDTVAGLTILAAGTSVPELISSVIVVKNGLANMAICNAVGSNIFDILFCLGMPWLIKAAFFSAGQGSLLIKSSALTYTAITLLSTIILLILIFQAAKWKLSKTVGIQCAVLYVVFVVLACLYELNIFGAFNLPNCPT